MSDPADLLPPHARRPGARAGDGPAAPPGHPRAAPPGAPSGAEVFEILVREHADMLAAFLHCLLRAPDAVDDLFQETMLTAWRRLDDYDRDRPFGPWLRGIATRLVLRHRERRAREAARFEPAALAALERRFAAAGRDPERFRETRERLEDCLARLPQKLRAAIALAYEQELRLHQVAARLYTTEEAAKKRVQRGRRLLADCLRRPGGSP